jgi:hypothetical protein
MARDLTTKQQRFADLVLGGMPASRAYREAGYTASTDGAAEASASRLLRSAKVQAYLAARRAGAAAKAELTFAGVLGELAEFARDKGVEAQHRFAAYKFLADQLARTTPIAVPVVDRGMGTNDERAFGLALRTLEAVLEGRLAIAQAVELMNGAKPAFEAVAGFALLKEMRGPDERAEHKRTGPLPMGHPARPKWLVYPGEARPEPHPPVDADADSRSDNER